MPPTDRAYLITGYLLLPAAFLGAFLWLEWRGLGVASLGTITLVFMARNRLAGQGSDAARLWKRYLLIAAWLTALQALLFLIAWLANRWGVVGLVVLISLPLFGALFLTLSISFVNGIRAAAPQKRLWFWIFPQGALLMSCLLVLLIAD